jgi:hypothetical protein
MSILTVVGLLVSKQADHRSSLDGIKDKSMRPLCCLVADDSLDLGEISS